MPDRHHLPPGLESYSSTLLGILRASVEQVGLPERLIARHLGPAARDDTWYPAVAFLAMLSELRQVLGANSLFSMGKLIPETALWPPQVTDIQQGLASIDVAYHMNHRLDSRPLFDPATGAMTDGIGHYEFRMDGKRRGIMRCDNPYPSDFDRGLVTGTARRFRPNAEVRHDDQQPSRLRNGESCTFVIAW